MKKVLSIIAFLLILPGLALAAGKSRDFDGASQRIKEIEAPGMWQDFYSSLQPFSKTYCYVNDFTNYDSRDWIVTEALGNGSLIRIRNERNGILDFNAGTTSAVEDSGIQIQSGHVSDNDNANGMQWAPLAGKNLWFEAKIAGDDVDQNDVFVGLHTSDNSIIASRGADFIGFSVDDGDANLDVATSSSSSISTDPAVTTMSDSTYAKIGFKVSGTDKVEFYVNDVLESTLSSNIPTNLLRLSIASMTGEAAANHLYVDYVVVCEDR